MTGHVGALVVSVGRLVVNLGTTSDVPAVTRTSAAGRVTVVSEAIKGGLDVLFDLRKGPHVLICGTTGSGKSVAIHNILKQVVAGNTSWDTGVVLIDPKRVELLDYEGLPHVAGPHGSGVVYRDPTDAVSALEWTLRQIEARFSVIRECRARDIDQVPREALQAAGQPRYLLLVVDELADLVMSARMVGRGSGQRGSSTGDGWVRGGGYRLPLGGVQGGASSDPELTLARILQIGRAAGVHAILATQRPSADVVTGFIKANVPSRLTFALQSAVDSRVAMGRRGAEELEGAGDALWFPAGARMPVKVQGAKA